MTLAACQGAANERFTAPQYTKVYPLSGEVLTPESISGNAPNTTTGIPYSYRYASTAPGGCSSSAVSGSFPPGLTLNGPACTLSGTATKPGTYRFAVATADGVHQVSDTMTVAANTAEWISGHAPSATVGVRYSYAYATNSATGCWPGALYGSLPGGLSFSGPTCTVSGTPAKAGTSSFTVFTADGSQYVDDSIVVAPKVVQPPPPPAHVITVNNPGSQATVMGTKASLLIQATDSVASTLTYKATGLPAGLSINASTGLISGPPTAAGSNSVTVTVTDPTGASGSVTFAWTVTTPTPPPPAHVVTVTYPGGRATQATTVAAPLQIRATDSVPSKLTYSSVGLPPGLSINASTGLISGTPTTPGTYTVVVTASDSTGASGATTIWWSIYPAPVPPPASPITFTNPGNQLTPLGTAVNLPLQVSGPGAPFYFFVTNLPPGLSVNATTRTITGVPTRQGDYLVVISALNQPGQSASLNFTWNIATP